MIKWAEVARTTSKFRFELLSKILTENGVENELTFVEMSPIEFEQNFTEIAQEYDHLRIGSPYGQPVVTMYQGLSSSTVFLNAADYMFKKEGVILLKSANLEGIRRIIKDVGQGLDFDSAILVVGAGAGARVAIDAFVKIGVNKVKVTNKFVEQAKELIEELEGKYFGVDFTFIPEDQLVTLPGTNSVLINTTPLVPSNDLLKELYYFNFLATPGLVIDFTEVPVSTPLVLEAEQIGIQTVRGFEVSSWADVFWVEEQFGIKLNREEYARRLKEVTDQIEFDISPFTKD